MRLACTHCVVYVFHLIRQNNRATCNLTVHQISIQWKDDHVEIVPANTTVTYGS
jgi:hypothetical protein